MVSEFKEDILELKLDLEEFFEMKSDFFISVDKRRRIFKLPNNMIRIEIDVKESDW